MTSPQIDYAQLKTLCQELLAYHGCDAATQESVTKAMMHGSLYGVDSHGVRLLPHYIKVMASGRVNPRPQMRFVKTRAGTGVLDADHAVGARAMYGALEHGIALAQEAGIAGIGVQNSSHFGPAGAYTLEAARRGYIALTVCNSDSIVRLHDGAEAFHGTNPISCAAPAEGNDLWHFDMATSAVPLNRVELYRSLGHALPPEVASDGQGQNTTDPDLAVMLAPLGGEFGFKGAGLAGLAEILSAVLTGMRISSDLAKMGDYSVTNPREMGSFLMVIDPDGFIGQAVFRAGLSHYLDAVRSSKAVPGGRVLAPGDREWEVARRRREEGIPLDPVTIEGLRALAQEAGVAFAL